MLNEEPAQSQDLQMMGMLLPLGIEKGKDFKPDVATVARLNSAAAEAHAWLLATQCEDWYYTRTLYQVPGVAETVHFDHIKAHYYGSHRTINPTGIIPSGPRIDFTAPTRRAVPKLGG
jgi:hypothetical protein